MKTFVIEGCNWRQEIEVDDSLFEKHHDMVVEAMTQCIENINNGEANNLIKECFGQEFMVGPVLVGWEKGKSKNEVMVLTEHIFLNASCYEAADTMRQITSEKEF